MRRHRLFALLLRIHMHGGSKRFVLPTGDRGERQQGTRIMGSTTRGLARLVSVLLPCPAEQAVLLQVSEASDRQLGCNRLARRTCC